MRSGRWPPLFTLARGSVGESLWLGHAFDFSLELDCGGERKKTVRYRRLGEGIIAVSFNSGGAEITLIDVRTFPTSSSKHQVCEGVPSQSGTAQTFT